VAKPPRELRRAYEWRRHVLGLGSRREFGEWELWGFEYADGCATCSAVGLWREWRQRRSWRRCREWRKRGIRRFVRQRRMRAELRQQAVRR
jgi:hypothetical protein